jgi:hypothetical protein
MKVAVALLAVLALAAGGEAGPGVRSPGGSRGPGCSSSSQCAPGLACGRRHGSMQRTCLEAWLAELGASCARELSACQADGACAAALDALERRAADPTDVLQIRSKAVIALKTCYSAAKSASGALRERGEAGRVSTRSFSRSVSSKAKFNNPVAPNTPKWSVDPARSAFRLLFVSDLQPYFGLCMEFDLTQVRLWLVVAGLPASLFSDPKHRHRSVSVCAACLVRALRRD